MAIWQDLVDDYGLSHSYQSVGRFVEKLRCCVSTHSGLCPL